MATRLLVPGLLAAAVAVPAAAQAPLVIPPPRGMVNDLAGVLRPADVAALEALARRVREQSGGEIAIVTLRDLAGRDPAQVALQIGREWGVGANTAVGDRARNAGVVVLLVPRETSTDGAGHIRIEVGNGAEGFIPDAVAGRIRLEGTEYFRRRDYGRGLRVITTRLAERYAAEFGFALGAAAPPAPPRPGPRRERLAPVATTIIVVGFALVAIASMAAGRVVVPGGHRRRRRGRPGGFGSFWDFGGAAGGASGFSDFFGSGGGGGSDFGGFGGGGGFSGGGAGGDF